MGYLMQVAKWGNSLAVYWPAAIHLQLTDQAEDPLLSATLKRFRNDSQMFFRNILRLQCWVQ